MNANQVRNMVTKVPAIRKSVDLKSFNVSEHTLLDLTPGVYRLPKVSISESPSVDLSWCPSSPPLTSMEVL